MPKPPQIGKRMSNRASRERGEKPEPWGPLLVQVKCCTAAGGKPLTGLRSFACQRSPTGRHGFVSDSTWAAMGSRWRGGCGDGRQASEVSGRWTLDKHIDVG